MEFHNKTVWITGASAGIGAELAEQLSQKGARLILSARSTEKLEQLKERCQGHNHQVVPLDLSHPETCGNRVEAIWNQVGGIDILINNAGVSQRAAALDTSLTVDRQLMEINYFGTVALTKPIAKMMCERKSGHIISVASVAGKIGSPMRSGYAAAKHALIGFMDCLRAETANHGVSVHVINPGFVQTAIAHNGLTGDGSLYAKDDPENDNGMPVNLFVGKMLKVLEKELPEATIASGKPWLGYQLRRLLPNTYHRLLPKIYKRTL